MHPQHHSQHDHDQFGYEGHFGPTREEMRARQIVGLLVQVPGWAIGALVRRIHTEIRKDSRRLLLEPNKDSELKIERYTFAVNDTIDELGKEQEISGSNSPDVNFRPQRVTVNVTGPATVMIVDARVANVSFTVGGEVDAWQWNPHAVGQELDVPTLTPANKASFSGRYTGRVTPDMQDLAGKPYPFSMAFTGPASIVA